MYQEYTAMASRKHARQNRSRPDNAPWRTGADLALALIEDASDVGDAASLEAQYRAIGQPQNNFVLGYLQQVARFGDPAVTEAFAAVLSEYVSSCEGGGVPDVEFLRKIAASAPGPGTDANHKDDDAAEPDERPELTVLVGDHVHAIHGLQAVCQAIVNLDENESIGLAIAAREFATRIADGAGSLLMETERQIEQATGMKVRQ